MPGEIIASNDLLRDRADRLFDLFNSGHSLRLFVNDFKPKPGDAIGSFAEASFAGYARKNMDAQWGTVFKVIDGEWEFISKSQVWTGGIGADQVIRGWYLVGGGKVKLSARLPVEKHMVPTGVLEVRISCQVWATAIL